MLFGAKAAPAYTIAKDIIHLILCLSEIVNNDPEVSPWMKVVMVENYNVTWAEKLIPACDVSEQTLPGAKEASGTGNMKFMMNGAVTIGTLDGANIEIMQAAGRENIYIFGLTAEEVEKGYSSYRASEVYETNPAIRRAMEQLIDGTLCPENPRLFQDLYHALLFGDGGGMADPYFVLKDLPGYVRAQAQVGADYQIAAAGWNGRL